MSDKEVVGLSRLISLWQRVNELARNVANQDTAGFRSERINFHEFLSKAKDGDNKTLAMRSMVASTAFTDFSPGQLKLTGNALDAAIVGDAFFVVRTKEGERYTRSGSFSIDGSGSLVTQSGHAVLSEAGPVSVAQGDGSVTISADGSISTAKGIIGRLRLVRFDDMSKLSGRGASQFSASSSPIDLPSTEVRLVTGAIEKSNVNGVQEMSALISATRAYDLVANAILKDTDNNQLKRLAGEDL